MSSERDPRPVLLLGIVLLFLGGLVARALHGPPPPIGYRINRSLHHQTLGDGTRAYRELQQVLEESPHDRDAWFRVGRVLASLGRPLEAAVYFQRAAELDPDSHLIRYELAKALAAGGLPARAEQEVERALAGKHDHADALYLRSALAASRGDVDSAVRYLEQALDSSASNPDRFRWDPLFDPVRNDARFLEVVLARRLPGVFEDSGPS